MVLPSRGHFGSILASCSDLGGSWHLVGGRNGSYPVIYREEFFPPPACPINQLMLDVHLDEEPIYNDLTGIFFFFFGMVEFTLNV